MKRFILIFFVIAVAITAGVCFFILNNCPESKAAEQIRAYWDQSYAYGEKACAYGERYFLTAWDWCKSKLPKKDEAEEPSEPEKAETEPQTEEDPAVEVEEKTETDNAEKPGEPAVNPYPRSFAKANWYGGRGLVTSDIKGKTILVYLWNRENQESVELLPRIEQVWKSYKHLPIMVIGSHRGGVEVEGKLKDVEKIVRKQKLSFPNFEGAGFRCEPRGIKQYPYVYVVNPQGKIVYRGHSDREATAALVNAIDFNGKK